MVVWSVCFNLAYNDGTKTILEISQDEKALSVRSGDNATWEICRKLPKFTSFLNSIGVGGTADFPNNLLDYNFRFAGTTTDGTVHVLGGSNVLEAEVVANADLPTILAELRENASFASYFYTRFAVLINTSYVDYAPGDPNAEASNLIGTLTGFGRTVATFVDITASGFAAALAGTRMVFIPEQESGILTLDAGTRTVVKNWVNSGGVLLTFFNGSSFYGLNDSFINDTFDLSIVTTTGSGPYSKSADAAGSPVSDGPSTLSVNNATSVISISSLPVGGKAYYGNGTQAAVASIPYGSGEIIFMGWDWWDSTGAIDPSRDPNWFTVLDLLTR